MDDLGQGAISPGLSAVDAVLLFAGVPLVICLLITVTVYASEGRFRGGRRSCRATAAGAPVAGLAVHEVRCWVATERGREVHHITAVAAGRDARQLGRACWTVHCVRCDRMLREDDNVGDGGGTGGGGNGGDATDVHFAGTAEAVAHALTEGWVRLGRRMYCGGCAVTVLGGER